MQVLIFVFNLNSVNDSPPTQVTKIAFQLHSSPISPYPDLMMCVVTQTRPRLILIQVSRLASRLNPGSISTPSSYGDMRLTSIQFPSHLHPSPKVHASPTSRSCLTLTHAPIFASHIHLSDVSSPSRSWKLHLSSIQVNLKHIQAWYLHPTSIQVQKITSQLHPSPISPYSGLMMCTSTQSRSHLSPTQMSIFVFDLYPGNIKPWSRSRDLHLTSKEAPSHLRPGRRIRVSAPTRCHLTPFKSENLHLNSIYVLSLPHLHPGHISYQSKPKYLHLTSIQVMSIAHVRHTSIQVLSHLHPNSISLSHLHPCTVSLPSRSEVSCLICIHVTSHLQSTHFHSVMIFASQLHPCPISHQSTFRY